MTIRITASSNNLVGSFGTHIGDTFTFCGAWRRPTTLSGGWEISVAQGTKSTLDSAGLIIYQSDTLALVGKAADNTVALADGEWVYLALDHNGSTGNRSLRAYSEANAAWVTVINAYYSAGDQWDRFLLGNLGNYYLTIDEGQYRCWRLFDAILTNGELDSERTSATPVHASLVEDWPLDTTLDGTTVDLTPEDANWSASGNEESPWLSAASTPIPLFMAHYRMQKRRSCI